MAAFQNLEGLQVFTSTYQLIQGAVTLTSDLPESQHTDQYKYHVQKQGTQEERSAEDFIIYTKKYVDLKDKGFLALIDSLSFK